MKKLPILFFFLSVLCFSQINNQSDLIVVNYTHVLHLEGMPKETKINSTLLSNGTSAVYEMDFLNNTGLTELKRNDEKAVTISIKPTKNPIIHKELKEGEIYSKERIMSNFYLVKDDIDIFEWSLTNNYKEILGYNCQEALVKYRGREYRAYFTPKIPFHTGPWKFGGLPGLILNIESLDGAFKMTASSLEIKNNESDISNPFSNEKSMSWEDYIKIYERKYEELLHYKDESGVSRTIPKKNIETFITN